MLAPDIVEDIAASYPGLDGFERFHLIKRVGWCPYDEIAAELPAHGKHIEIGCGFGHFLVYLAQTMPELTLVGCDPDRRKIEVARTTRPAIDGRIAFFEGGFDDIGPIVDKPTSISIIDVLYLMDDATQARTLEWAADRLAPGGRLVIKTLDVERGWASRQAELQEFIMVRLLRRTASSGAWRGSKKPGDYLRRLKALGLDATARSLSGTRTPSLLVTADKP